MNTPLDFIFSRRSIRKYLPRPIDSSILEQLVRAGMYAPSARNTRSWQFILIRDRKILSDLADVHPYGKMLKEAAAAILVCGDPGIENMESYLLQNCSAATQNILLAAHCLGLGAVWLGIHPRHDRMEGMIKVLKLPDPILPVSLIAIGYPAEKKEMPDRYEPSKIHFDGW